MSALREVLAQFGVEVDTKQLDHATEKIDGFIEGLEKVAKGVGAAFAVHEVFEFAESTARAIHQVEASAAALGISTEATQQFGYASKAAGMDAGELLNMMGRLQVSAAHAGKGEMGAAFKKLGVNVKDSNGKIRDADVLFEDVAEGISKIKDPAQRAARAVELLGRQGRVLLPFLGRGKAGIEELRAEFSALGGGFDEEAIEKSKEFEHGMAKVSVVVDGLKGVIVKGLFPVLNWIATKAAAIGGWFVKMTKNTEIFRSALLLLGAYLAPLAIQMALAFAPILLAGAAIAVLIFLVDDLIGMFTGADSVIGDVIDKIFGKGSSAEVVESVKDAWVAVKEAFIGMWPAVQKVYEALKWIVEHSGVVGDKLGQNRNADIEQRAIADGSIKKGAQGRTYGENVVAKNADAYHRAEASGADMSAFHFPELPKGETTASMTSKVQAYVPQAVKQLPGEYGPSQQGDTNIDVSIQGTNVNEADVKRAIVEAIRSEKQNSNRAAKHVLTQAGVKP